MESVFPRHRRNRPQADHTQGQTLVSQTAPVGPQVLHSVPPLHPNLYRVVSVPSGCLLALLGQDVKMARSGRVNTVGRARIIYSR